MKIGILQTAYKKASDYGAFYNVQELGLARALAKRGHEVTLYKAVDGDSKSYEETFDTIDKEDNSSERILHIKLCQTKYLGINGLFDVKLLDKSLDVLIYFSDTQISVASVYKWCKSNDVRFVPYVGVIESHSENPVNKILMRYVAKRNTRIYQKVMVLAKTPDMASKLRGLKCTDVKLFPVGLDETVMHGQEGADMLGGIVDEKRSGENNETFVRNLLFIGRMEDEKQPLEMVRIYDELLSITPALNLTMIGDGHLYDEVKGRLTEVCVKHGVTFAEEIAPTKDSSEGIEEESKESLINGICDDMCYTPVGKCSLLRKVPYNQMHQYYKDADVYINLNEVEILGMSILEAMYYGTLVVAIKAPGPDFILTENNESSVFGMVAPEMEALEEVLRLLVKGEIESTELDEITKAARRRVRENFLWDSLSGKLETYID